MPLACLFVDDSTVAADLHSLTVVALMGRDELDAAVPVSVVVPVHERRHPLACLLHAGEWPPRVIRPVLGGSEQRF
jgi:hypothetical protein